MHKTLFVEDPHSHAYKSEEVRLHFESVADHRPWRLKILVACETMYIHLAAAVLGSLALLVEHEGPWQMSLHGRLLGITCMAVVYFFALVCVASRPAGTATGLIGQSSLLAIVWFSDQLWRLDSVLQDKTAPITRWLSTIVQAFIVYALVAVTAHLVLAGGLALYSRCYPQTRKLEWGGYRSRQLAETNNMLVEHRLHSTLLFLRLAGSCQRLVDRLVAREGVDRQDISTALGPWLVTPTEPIKSQSLEELANTVTANLEHVKCAVRGVSAQVLEPPL